MKRRAMVRISSEALASILHLRQGIAVTGAKYNPKFDHVEIYLTGEQFPPMPKNAEVANYPLRDLMEDME